jgi:hypothetical protein
VSILILKVSVQRTQGVIDVYVDIFNLFKKGAAACEESRRLAAVGVGRQGNLVL